MIRICVVGGIGSGKSHIAKLFGYPVFNADIEVRKIYKESEKCFKKLKKKLPGFIFSFPIKKYELLNAILHNQNNLKKINKIVHTEVRNKMKKFLKKNKKKKIIVLDIPLLLENKINKKKDVIVFIDSHKKETIKRLKRRANYNVKFYNKLTKLQLPLEEKKKKSDFIIKNNFKSKYVKKNVNNILKKF